MILASHGIFTAYGFWLPNDPRGSWSDFIRKWDLLRFGNATKTDTRKSVAHTLHDRQTRLAAKSALKFDPIHFSGVQARAISRGFATTVKESGYEILVCSIMPDHVHIVVRRHERAIEKIIAHLKARATQQLIAESLHPFVHLATADGRFPSVWADRAWKVFLDSNDDITGRLITCDQTPSKPVSNLKTGISATFSAHIYAACSPTNFPSTLTFTPSISTNPPCRISTTISQCNPL